MPERPPPPRGPRPTCRSREAEHRPERARLAGPAAPSLQPRPRRDGGDPGLRPGLMSLCRLGPQRALPGWTPHGPSVVRLRASRGRMSCKGPARGHVGARGGRRQGGVGLAWGPGERAGRGAGPGGWCRHPAHRFQAQHRPAQRAVSQEPQAARIRCQVPADVAAALRPQVQGHDEAPLLHMPAQLLQDAPRLADQGPCRAAGVTVAPLVRTDAAAL